MSRKNFAYHTKGTWLGVKINTTGFRFAEAMAKSKMSRSNFLNTIMPLFQKRIKKDRIPTLKDKLVNGGYKGTIGTMQFENTAHGKHKPHYDNRNPISYIFKKHTRYSVKVDGDKLKIEMNLVSGGSKRDARANFHYEMPTVPRVSTILSRLDATCLPYISEGHRDKIIGIWLRYSARALQSELKKFILGQSGGY